MSKVSYKQADLERGIRAAKAQSLPISCIQITSDGTTQIIIGDPLPARNLAQVRDGEINEWDAELGAE
ncbi:hypothetical protein [Salaquimonas pukyongi]|uniref:hypothetical protein n=1 Tax=Salaquimonas pukyongi TaxID=2712698 RepID=UPI00096BBC2C|nr:hypothetical protein [Salaquimonas pukyongi]